MTLNFSRVISNPNPNPNPKYAPQRRYARTKKGKVASNKAQKKRYVKLSNTNMVCLCGSTYNTYHRARHYRTNKHQRAVRLAGVEVEGSVPAHQRAHQRPGPGSRPARL